jgi:hypothetical protein
MLKIVLFCLLFVQSLASQTWYWNTPPVGWLTQQQAVGCGTVPCDGGAWKQGISMSVDTAGSFTNCGVTRTSFKLGHNAIIGTSMGWAWPQHETGGYIPVFAIETGFATFPNCFMGSSPVTVPGAAVGYDQLFLSNYATFTPQYVFQYQGLGTYDWFFMNIPVPNNTTYLGMFIAAQAIRLDPINGQLYLSDRLDGIIW